MKHAQRTEKYIRLIFNSYISDDDFFQKFMRIIDTVFFWRFSRPRGHYATLNTVVFYYLIETAIWPDVYY